MVNNLTEKDLEKAKQDGQLLSDISQIKNDVIEIKGRLEKNYVTKAELETFKAEMTPIIKLVYGLVSLFLTGIVVAIISLVIKS